MSTSTRPMPEGMAIVGMKLALWRDTHAPHMADHEVIGYLADLGMKAHEAAQAAAATPSPELPRNAPEGWSAWPLWRRAVVVVPAWLGAITGLTALLLTR
ncbi:hypothetical protein [Insolitispirillum peregrinum]|uniref:hypothetical protein n=1 Tax=Insolitispirillum peregrinum TaxID=80876 RepID=UPI00361B0536